MSQGGAFQTDTNLANHRHCTKLLAHWQWRGQWQCGLGLLRNTPSFCCHSAHTPAYRICWGIQLLVPPLGNLLTLKSPTLHTCFSVFQCLPALSISRVGEAITKTIPRNRRKLIKLMLRKCTFLLPRSQLIGQFIKRHLVTIRREQHILAQWLRQYFCQDHGVRSVAYIMYMHNKSPKFGNIWCLFHFKSFINAVRNSRYIKWYSFWPNASKNMCSSWPFGLDISWTTKQDSWEL